MKKVILVLVVLPILASTPIVYRSPAWARSGDVVITEIMADPQPEVSLPGEEFLEISNRTDHEFSLLNWKLRSGDQKYLLPAAIIKPGEVIILCHEPDTSLFSKFGKVLGLKQFPVLTDAGKIICLVNGSDSLIHGVEYSDEWYRDVLKEDGGWSLEMIDINFPFSGKDNWKASSSRLGGTPGKVNSMAGSNPDISFRGVENVFPDDSLNIVVRFSEPLINSIEVLKGSRVGEKTVIAVTRTDQLSRVFTLHLAEELEARIIYNIEVPGALKDFAGNLVQKRNFQFGLAEKAAGGDIRFNELLFNPFPGDPDYIELHNCSDKILDVSRLQLATVNDETGDTSRLYQISSEKRCFLPGTYYAFTEGRENILNRFPDSGQDHLFSADEMPSMSDDEGHLLIYNRELEKIDEVYYNEKMHYQLLSGHEGIALEKTDPCSGSEVAINWHSAAGSAGWGTPGAPNSIFSEERTFTDEVSLSSSRITPDNDGYEDFLTITFDLAGTGNVISIAMFDEAGNQVRSLVKNMLSGPGASFLWDGTADDGSPVRTGIYIVFITMYDDSGKTNKWKKVCTVLR